MADKYHFQSEESKINQRFIAIDSECNEVFFFFFFFFFFYFILYIKMVLYIWKDDIYIY